MNWVSEHIMIHVSEQGSQTFNINKTDYWLQFFARKEQVKNPCG